METQFASAFITVVSCVCTAYEEWLYRVGVLYVYVYTLSTSAGNSFHFAKTKQKIYG